MWSPGGGRGRGVCYDLFVLSFLKLTHKMYNDEIPASGVLIGIQFTWHNRVSFFVVVFFSRCQVEKNSTDKTHSKLSIRYNYRSEMDRKCRS